MEIWDLYDESLKPTGKTIMQGDPVPQGHLRWMVSALFLNSRGEVLLPRRAKAQEMPQDSWSVIEGAVLSGEDGRMACKRAVMEELGFAPDFERARIVWQEKDISGGWFRDVYLFQQDIPRDGMRILPEKIREDEALWQQLCAEVHFWQDYYPYLCLESMRTRIPEGVYRHYKGKRYHVKGLALHSETLEPMVIYQALYGAEETWVRPAAMWNEDVIAGGQSVRRFALEE